MIDARTAPYAATLLRLGLGSLFLAHAGMEISSFTPLATTGAVPSAGEPGWLSCVAIAGEVLGASALVLGFMPRLVALTLIPILLGALVAAQSPDGVFFGNSNSGLPFLALWLLALVAQALIGDGAFTLEPTPSFAGWSSAPAAQRQRHRDHLRRTRKFAQ